ncbi:formate-dependent phosphoribosylglycinamide formyltransferase [Mycolicibacterium chitae]|uniref:Phosphoribosylglycinamide formyltransferase 2 n=2 Tax=Mycobacteriaceae TaxID=1762 RepID=A0A3S4RQI5_MYCCI|nr:formate-dependent phosphoribosylglycinamide formyltransferase [Mycolicibacterium chitae]VEG49892.1 phosphoribosylglycinamide formyltransferase 2 [Mycolicibacterium chitae]
MVESMSAPRILLLGAGDLGREVVLSFQRLGAVVIAADAHPDAPALAFADESAVVDLTDPDAVAAAIDRFDPGYLVTATDDVAAEALAAAESDGLRVVPGGRRTRLTLDREALRRLAADELGLPTAPFWFAGSLEELGAVAAHAGYPLVVKPLVALPGEGQSVLLRPDDLEAAWGRATSAGAGHRVLVESVVEVDDEVTLLTVRTGESVATQFCEPIGHRHVDGVLEAWQPQPMTPVALDSARSIAARVVTALGGRGLFGVELLVRGDEVYFSDVTVLPHDSALVTLRSQRLSALDLHARAVLGLPVDTIMISPGAVEVSYRPGSRDNLSEALSVPETDVLLFPAPVGSPGAGRSRFEVVLATAPAVAGARERARQAAQALRGSRS